VRGLGVAPAQRTVRVPGSMAGVRQAAGELEAFAAAHGLAPEAIWSVQVALDEVLSNVVRHGYGGEGGERTVELAFGLAAGVLEVVIVDDALPFDARQVPEPDTETPIEERKIGGLGVAITRRLMDGIEYERRDGKNRLVLRKRMASAGGAG